MSLEVGQVFRLPCLSCVEKRRPKFFVVSLKWSELRYFLINTERSPFAAGMPTVARTQILLAQVEHSFLNYDSWLDCSIMKGDYTEAQVQEFVLRDARVSCGVLSANARAAVRNANERNALLPREFLVHLRAGWQ